MRQKAPSMGTTLTGGGGPGHPKGIVSHLSPPASISLQFLRFVASGGKASNQPTQVTLDEWL